MLTLKNKSAFVPLFSVIAFLLMSSLPSWSIDQELKIINQTTHYYVFLRDVQFKSAWDVYAWGKPHEKDIAAPGSNKDLVIGDEIHAEGATLTDASHADIVVSTTPPPLDKRKDNKNPNAKKKLNLGNAIEAKEVPTIQNSQPDKIESTTPVTYREAYQTILLKNGEKISNWQPFDGEAMINVEVKTSGEYRSFAPLTFEITVTENKNTQDIAEEKKLP